MEKRVGSFWMFFLGAISIVIFLGMKKKVTPSKKKAIPSIRSLYPDYLKGKKAKSVYNVDFRNFSFSSSYLYGGIVQLKGGKSVKSVTRGIWFLKGVHFHDVNGDGKDDVIVVIASSNRFGVLRKPEVLIYSLEKNKLKSLYSGVGKARFGRKGSQESFAFSWKRWLPPKEK